MSAPLFDIVDDPATSPSTVMAMPHPIHASAVVEGAAVVAVPDGPRIRPTEVSAVFRWHRDAGRLAVGTVYITGRAIARNGREGASDTIHGYNDVAAAGTAHALATAPGWVRAWVHATAADMVAAMAGTVADIAAPAPR